MPFTDDQLQDLLQLSHWRNKKLGVTGVLLYGNAQFLQVLEGEEAAVQQLYAHIRQDARHGNIITFASKAVEQRAFADWAMAFQPATPEQFTRLTAYLGTPETAVDTAAMTYSDTRLFELLRSFVLP